MAQHIINEGVPSDFVLAKHQQHRKNLLQGWFHLSRKTARIQLGCQHLLWRLKRQDRYAESIMKSLQGSKMSSSVLLHRWQKQTVTSVPYRGRQSLVDDVTRQLTFIKIGATFSHHGLKRLVGSGACPRRY